MYLELEVEASLEGGHDVAHGLPTQSRPARTVEIPDLLRGVGADDDSGHGPNLLLSRCWAWTFLLTGATPGLPRGAGRVEVLRETQQLTH